MPVSNALEEELRSELRRKGRQIVWLDRNGDYADFVDGLRQRWKRGDFSYPVTAYRGSFLELIFQLDEFVDRTEHRAVLIHMPGHNEESIRETPVFEHYAAGKRYRKKLATLVEEAAAGDVAPREIDAFLEDESLTLEAADDWLFERTREKSLLSKLSITELWSRLSRAVDEELPEEEADFGGVLKHLEVRVGLSEGWRRFSRFSTGTVGDEALAPLADELAGWAMAVEYVHDLKRAPMIEELQALTELPESILEECQKLTCFLRETSGFEDVYIRIADELGELLRKEFEAGSVDELGDIDTFRFEERRFFRGALQALGKEQWEMALERSRQRARGGSFWIDDDPKRGHAWTLLRSAAALGKAVSDYPTPLAGAQSLPEAVQSYVEGAWRVDKLHRQLEQRRAALLEPGLDEFSKLRKRLDEMRVIYRQWADELAYQFNDLCERVGFIPTESLQQRHIFEQVVEPWTYGEEKTAVVMVDALRYEMAEALRADLEEVGTTIHLDGRLAELPTVTAVGMNALAPVTDSVGRLQPIIRDDKFAGFETSVFQVRDPKSRKKMMRHRVEGRTCPLMNVSAVVDGSKDLNRVVSEASLVLVHSEGLDKVGEQGFGQLTFDTTLRDIRSAIRILREAGIQRFVITSDHGFLLLDSTTRRKRQHGKKTEPSARWRLYPGQQSDKSLVSTPLTALKYEGSDRHLVMPRDTSIFDQGALDKTFVHGGNSLQERMVPVLRVEYRRQIGGSTGQYQIATRVGESVMDMHCLELNISPEQGMLDLGGPRDVEIALRPPKGVTAELCSARGGARLRGASAIIPVEETVEIFFRLEAEDDRRARIEIYAPTQSDVVKAKAVDAQFDVIGVGPDKLSDGDKSEEQRESGSGEALEAIEDEAIRDVFAHIREYGSIDEKGATHMLGSARKFRRFSMKFEEYVERLPFVVEIRWSREKNLKEYVLN